MRSEEDGLLHRPSCIHQGGCTAGLGQIEGPRGQRHTCRPALSAVQVLKIRRPNYSDFSVKTMVIMKLLQQQNGNTVVVEKFESEFYVEI